MLNLKLSIAQNISIHAPHARSDMMRRPVMAAFYIFQSTLLMRGATAQMAVSTISSIFQSTLLMRGATQPCHQCHHGYLISIHAPHARSDRHLGDRHNHLCHISIHAPHARSDSIAIQCTCCAGCISIHAPHARSDEEFPVKQWQQWAISIHAPHARSDRFSPQRGMHRVSFQSTLLMRGATLVVPQLVVVDVHFNPRSSCEERPGGRGR